MPTAKKAKQVKKTAPVVSAPEALGHVASTNAFLAVVVADAEVAKAWGGTGDGSNLDGSDWRRASDALADAETAPITFGGKKKLAATLLHLGMGQGAAHVYRVGDRITFAEVQCEDLASAPFVEWIGAAPAKKAAKVAAVKIASGRATLLPIVATGTNDGNAKSLTFELRNGRYSLLLEPKTENPWGSGRRAHLVRG